MNFKFASYMNSFSPRGEPRLELGVHDIRSRFTPRFSPKWKIVLKFEQE